MVNKKIQLQDDGANLFPLATLNGIDVNNLIASSPSLPYYATEDSIMSCHPPIRVDDATISGSSSSIRIIVPIKKGQKITTTSGGSGKIVNVFGIKR